MELKEYKQGLLRFLGNHLLFRAISMLCATLKINYVNRQEIDKLLAGRKNFVLAFWHGSMLAGWYAHRARHFAAMVSRSKDGGMLDRVLRRWTYEVIRGSSHTGGSLALGIVVDYLKQEQPVIITPDGPRGPYHKLKPGAVIAAKRAGVPLILVGIGYKKKWELGSWDKFEIPAFFSRVNVVYSEPICIDADLTYEETSVIIDRCEVRLNELQSEAEKF